VILILENKRQNHRLKITKRKIALALGIVVLLIPEMVFIYYSWTTNTFGTNQARFSFQNFEQNIFQNLEFWEGKYGSIFFHSEVFGQPYWQSNIEWPTLYTVFAVLGLVLLFHKKKTRWIAAILATWFMIVLVFYTSYYAGGVLFSGGLDARYFMTAFPVMAILTANGSYSVVNRVTRILKKSPAITRLAMPILVLFILVDPIFEIENIVTRPIQDIYLFSDFRFDEQMASLYHNVVPHNCIILTYEPPLWDILNKSDMYADLFFNPNYRKEVLNYSHGCVYLEYSAWCALGQNVTACPRLMKLFNMSEIVSIPYDYPFNFSFLKYNYTLFKINSYKNGTLLT
jgi:hypothetical protein